MSIVITIDGPAGPARARWRGCWPSGWGCATSTPAPCTASSTAAALAAGTNLNDGAALAALVGTPAPAGADLRAQAVSVNVSAVSRHPQVRVAMRDRQRLLAQDAVLEGRDTGSVVCPQADLKLYLVASSRVRANRRAAELSLPVDEVERTIIERDDLDSDQLAPAADARLIDTSDLTAEQVVERIVGMLPGAPAAPAAAGPVPGDRFWRTVRPLAGPLFRGMLRLRISGAERVPRTGGLVFVANHQSLWDIPALGVAQPRAIRYMAKSELFRPRPFAAFLRSGGTFPVRRGEPDRDALRTVHDTVEAGGAVGIFMQGHRQEGLDEAKAGAGRIAVVEDAAVVAVAIRSRGWRPGRPIAVSFGSPRRYGRDGRRAGDAYRETADALMAEIRELYEGMA